MNNACTSRWCRRFRIIIKRQWQHFERHPMRLFCWLTGIIIVAFIACLLVWGLKESVYTAFGSFFTALAFVGVIVTVLLQRAELHEQRKELRAQRIELEGQKRELEIQNRTAQLQRFENSFFHLLEDFKIITSTFQGKIPLYDTHPFPYNNISYQRLKKIEDINLENLKLYLHNIYNNYPHIIKQFITEYYEIIDFIHTHDAFSKNINEIYKYISILSLQLNNSEYITLFYDAIKDNKKIELINKLHLFSKFFLLNKTYTPVRPEHILFFSPQAFGEDYEEYIERHGLQGKTLEDFLQ